MPPATPAEFDDSAAPIAFPAVVRKKATAAFDVGRLTSDGGVLLLAQAADGRDGRYLLRQLSGGARRGDAGYR